MTCQDIFLIPSLGR